MKIENGDIVLSHSEARTLYELAAAGYNYTEHVGYYENKPKSKKHDRDILSELFINLKI